MATNNSTLVDARDGAWATERGSAVRSRRLALWLLLPLIVGLGPVTWPVHSSMTAAVNSGNAVHLAGPLEPCWGCGT
jgi:hypothetical protein